MTLACYCKENMIVIARFVELKFAYQVWQEKYCPLR